MMIFLLMKLLYGIFHHWSKDIRRGFELLTTPYNLSFSYSLNTKPTPCLFQNYIKQLLMPMMFPL